MTIVASVWGRSVASRTTNAAARSSRLRRWIVRGVIVRVIAESSIAVSNRPCRSTTDRYAPLSWPRPSSVASSSNWTPASPVWSMIRRPGSSSPIAARRWVGTSSRARFSAMLRAVPPSERRTRPSRTVPPATSLPAIARTSQQAEPIRTTVALAGSSDTIALMVRGDDFRCAETVARVPGSVAA